MPTYVYKHIKPMSQRFGCSKGGKFEVKQSIKDDALELCPECGSYVKRVLQPVHFNANNWVRQDDPYDDAEKIM